MVETSAFEDVVEVEMEEEKKGGENEEAEIIEAKTRAKVNALTARFAHTHIDFKAVQQYFKQLKKIIKDNNKFKEAIKECIEVIDYQWSEACT